MIDQVLIAGSTVVGCVLSVFVLAQSLIRHSKAQAVEYAERFTAIETKLDFLIVSCPNCEALPTTKRKR